MKNIKIYCVEGSWIYDVRIFVCIKTGGGTKRDVIKQDCGTLSGKKVSVDLENFPLAPEDQADQHEQTCQDYRQGGDQAEQPGHDASQDHDQAELDELASKGDQAEEASQENRQGDDQAKQSDEGARQDDQPGGEGDIGEQTSSSTPLITRQVRCSP